LALSAKLDSKPLCRTDFPSNSISFQSVPISVNPLPLTADGFVCATTIVIDVNAIAMAKDASPLPSFGFVSRIDALQESRIDQEKPSKLRSQGPLATKSVPK
jgi:hypothetical protein